MASKHVTYMSDDARTAMFERSRSGAAGVHSDQRSRRSGAVGTVNRQGSRRSRKSAAIADQFR